MKFVSDNIKLIGKVTRETLVVPAGNKHLGIGCHIIELSGGEEIAVPNIRINLNQHLGRKLWYESQEDPGFPGHCRYRVVSQAPNHYGTGSLAAAIIIK